GQLPWVLGDEGLAPCLCNAIGIPVGLILSIGGACLGLLIGYGLEETVGVVMQRGIGPLVTTPGRRALDAESPLVGSYSLAISSTDRGCQQGGYTGREAAIVATGFSTVSAAFMVIVAKSLDLMHMWTTFFFATLVITFIVTAI